MLEIFKDENKEEEDSITNALSIMLWLLGKELEVASWLIEARSRIDPIELYDKK